MAWFAIYEIATGRLKSLGTIKSDPLRSGLAFIEFAQKPEDDVNMWDEGTLSYIPRPPKVLIDRLDDFEGHPKFLQFQEVFNTLNAQQKAKVRNALRAWLGDTIRNESEDVVIFPEAVDA